MDKAWEVVVNESIKPSNTPDGQLASALQVLKTNNFLDILCEFYLEKYRMFLSTEAIPCFWDTFSKDDCIHPSSKGSSVTLRLANAVDQLHEETRKWTVNNSVVSAILACLPEEERIPWEERLNQQLKASLLSNIPVHFHKVVLLVYNYCFRISRHVKARKNQKENEEEESFLQEEDMNANNSGCPVCGKNVMSDSSEEGMNEDDVDFTTRDPSMYSSTTDGYSCNCNEILEAFDKMNLHLQEMLVLSDLAEDAVTSVVLTHIEKYVKQQTRSCFYVRIIDQQLSRVGAIVSEWLQLVYHRSLDDGQQQMQDWLVHFAYEVFSRIRIDQLFDIIIEFPDSIPALTDLKSCIDKCFSFRADVVNTLGKSFDQRLLHPGVATNDILTAYIQTIKALRLLDPTGVILQLVCDPLKTYLKGKEDTVRCIITALTDENSDLIPELVSKTSGEETGSQSDDEVVIRNWQTWKPDPIDAAKAPKHTRSVRSSDIVSILVDVYESKDLFVEEFQRLLSQRFLTAFDCNVDFERRNLELLTLKFGEYDLHPCEVMLQDMTSSRRIDSRINSGEIAAHHFKDFAINCIIVSAQFWPEKFCLLHFDEGANVILPEAVDTAIDTYTKAFETIKGSRTLLWRRNLGSVDIELEFEGDKTICMTVPAIQAAIITRFQEKCTWKLACLSPVVGLPVSLLRRKLVFWLKKGILKQVSPDEFSVIEDQSDNSSSQPTMEMDFTEESMLEDDLSSPSNKKSSDGVEDDKFRSLWSYIENILTNLSDMTLEKIHDKLRMFALQGPSFGDLTLQELRFFLEAKTREGKLIYSAGYYKLS